MAMESQGISVQRESTAAGSTAISTGVDIDCTTSLINRGSGDFTVDGFTTAMIISLVGSTNKGAYRLASVAATSMQVYGSLIAEASGANITIEGHPYDDIAEIKGFNGPTGTANIVDVSNLKSTAKEKMMMLRDEGQLNLDVWLNMDATAMQSALRQDRAARTMRSFAVIFNDSTVRPSGMIMDAYVSGFAVQGSVDNAIAASIVFEISSAVKIVDKVT